MLTSLSLTYFSARRNTATVFDSRAGGRPLPSSGSARGGAARGARRRSAAPAAPTPAPQPEANAAPARRGSGA